METDEFVKYTVQRVTIDGAAFAAGKTVKLTLFATVVAGLPGEPMALKVDDWAGPSPSPYRHGADGCRP